MKFYKTVAVPTFLSASETWSLGKRDVQRIQAAEMKFLRGAQGDVYKRQTVLRPGRFPIYIITYSCLLYTSRCV